MYYCVDPFQGPLNGSRHLRGSIKRPVIKKHGFQCNPGIDGGKGVAFTSQIMYCFRDHFWGPLSESGHLRGSIRLLVIKTLDFSVILELKAR